MNPIAEALKQNYEKRLSGDLESCNVPAIGKRIYWRPLTGKQQKIIQKWAEKSVAEGICMHVKTRALDEQGEAVFKDLGVVALMNDFEFESLAMIFGEMTGMDLSTDDIEGN